MALVADINSSIMNSYVTTQEAAVYFADRGHGEAWDDVENPASFLITATNQLDWFMRFKGQKVVVSQPLEWPRRDVLESDGYTYVSVTEIPVRVKQAVMELALQSIDTDRVADSDMAGLQEVKVGSLKIVSNMVGPWQEKKNAIPAVIYKMLSSLITNSSSMFKRVERGY